MREVELFALRFLFSCSHLEIGDSQEPFCNRNDFISHVHSEERAITQRKHI